ncbi:hypothetical protein BC828DRAFT_394241 [Blastocladiella britannica]|nr:hypothetical protein BC828DRAFT_394241 [Blastocladiella britannica]
MVFYGAASGTKIWFQVYDGGNPTADALVGEVRAPLGELLLYHTQQGLWLQLTESLASKSVTGQILVRLETDVAPVAAAPPPPPHPVAPTTTVKKPTATTARPAPARPRPSTTHAAPPQRKAATRVTAPPHSASPPRPHSAIGTPARVTPKAASSASTSTAHARPAVHPPSSPTPVPRPESTKHASATPSRLPQPTPMSSSTGAAKKPPAPLRLSSPPSSLSSTSMKTTQVVAVEGEQLSPTITVQPPTLPRVDPVPPSPTSDGMHLSVPSAHHVPRVAEAESLAPSNAYAQQAEALLLSQQAPEGEAPIPFNSHAATLQRARRYSFGDARAAMPPPSPSSSPMLVPTAAPPIPSSYAEQFHLLSAEPTGTAPYYPEPYPVAYGGSGSSSYAPAAAAEPQLWTPTPMPPQPQYLSTQYTGARASQVPVQYTGPPVPQVPMQYTGSSASQAPAQYTGPQVPVQYTGASVQYTGYSSGVPQPAPIAPQWTGASYSDYAAPPLPYSQYPPTTTGAHLAPSSYMPLPGTAAPTPYGGAVAIPPCGGVTEAPVYAGPLYLPMPQPLGAGAGVGTQQTGRSIMSLPAMGTEGTRRHSLVPDTSVPPRIAPSRPGPGSLGRSPAQNLNKPLPYLPEPQPQPYPYSY